MVCSADDLIGWRDFPKGLRVLLLDEDPNSAQELKSKLEEMDYIVSTFCNECDALSAITNKVESFHVAVVEVSRGNSNRRYTFLEAARDLPTIVISNIHCLNTMMKCIALGAAEFLQKPLSEEKLRNIWQHVVHKAFNAGENLVSKSLKPIKETVAYMLQLQSNPSTLVKNSSLSDGDNSECAKEHGEEQSLAGDEYPAPSTPQLDRARSMDNNGDCADDKANCSTKESDDQRNRDSSELQSVSHSESKFVENTCISTAVDAVAANSGSPSFPGMPLLEEEVDSAIHSKSHEGSDSKVSNSCSRDGGQKKASAISNAGGTRTSKKKVKVDWTADLHRRFVQAVEQLGIDHAIPSKILELMKVEGLTRHNVASHLQKYRMHKRHIMPKDDDRKWLQQREQMRSYMHKPAFTAFPAYHPNCGLPVNQIYPVWGHPSCPTPSHQMWGHPRYPTWQPQENWLWRQSHPRMQADAWGCPVVAPQYCPPLFLPPQDHGFAADGMEPSRKSFDLQPEEEVIDKVVKEVMSQPWLPLPLGLKPPSAESVLSELHSQGIKTVPPPRPHHDQAPQL